MLKELDLAQLDRVAHLPQHPRLVRVVAELWRDPVVAAIWLGGSLARGAGDAWSDVDLRVAVAPAAFDPDAVPAGAARLVAEVVGMHALFFGLRATLFHMLLADGEIYDLLVQTTEHTPTTEARVVLGCRDDAFGERLIHGDDPSPRVLPAEAAAVRQLIVDFWMNQIKLQRVLARGLPLMAWEGIYRMRQDLIRLWYVAATGNDPGPLARTTIHSLAPVTRAVQQQHGSRALLVLGEPLRDEQELLVVVATLIAEMKPLGRALAAQLGFEYPAAAEATVERSWYAFRQR
jgi:predicted nucleotidyltransferase